MKTFKEIREACWKGYKQVGTKKKGGKDVPNCVPEETVEEATVELQALDPKNSSLQRSLKRNKVNMTIVERPKPSNGNAFIVKLTGDTKGIKSVLKTQWDGEYYDEIEENKMNEAKKIQDIARKYKRELQKIQKSGNLELSKKAEDELYQWASSNGEIRGDEEDEFWNWIDKNVDDLIKGKIKEGVYTKNDGGAFDGLRIAKWLAHEDGKSWRKLKYGDTDSYLRAAADLLKQDKAKAKSILSKPTPRD